MKRILVVLFVLLLLPAGPVIAAAEVEQIPAMTDYAWGFPILTRSPASFYSVELPLEVNQSVTDPNLRDAGVYNGAGNAVTRVFRHTSDDVKETEHLVPLPVLPLLENSQQTADEVRLLFEQDGDRTRLEFNTDKLPATDPATSVTAYIVDTRSLTKAIEELELTWNPVSSGFIGRISVEGSNNLQDWNSVGGGAIADLQENGASVVQRRVTLRKTSHDYLRISWEGLPADWKLSQIQGYYVTGQTQIVRHTIVLESMGRDSTDRGQIFDLGGAPTVDRVRVVLPESNTVIAAQIFYWSDRQARWIRSFSGSFYNVGQGENQIVNDSASIGKIRIERFKVVVTRGRADVAMQLEIGWRPDTLIFLAQGEAPFTLATGRAADAYHNYPQQRLYGDSSIVGLATNKNGLVEAVLGPRYALGGSDNLKFKKSINWRQLSLWLGLILGVAFVGYMASRVIRDLKSD